MTQQHSNDPLSSLVTDTLRKTAVTARRARQKFRRLSSPRHIYTAPGTMVVSPDDAPPVITVFAYGPTSYKELVVTSVAEIVALGTEWPVLWVDVDGFGNAALLKEIADHFGIHPLAMEDATDTAQRAKSEPYGDATFLVLPMPHEDERGFWTEQLAIWVTAHVVVTFQSVPGDCLDPLRNRIRESKGGVRTSGAAFTKPDGRTLGKIRRIRAELIRVRRAVHPLRDAAIALASLDRVFDADTRHYLRDLNDHVSRVLDQLETDRYMANDLLDIYMTSINLKVAETSKVLTIIATLFMPLTFIAGVYGMNFKHMPELEWMLGYPFALGLMGCTVIGLMTYFWRKGWLQDTTK